MLNLIKKFLLKKNCCDRKRLFHVCAACGCVVGKVRDNNEDNFFFQGEHLQQDNCGLNQVIAHELPLRKPITYAVFDGMGGEAHGEVAAYIAVQTLNRYTKQAKRRPVDLTKVCMDANLGVCCFAEQHHVDIVGSTAVMLHLHKQMAEIVNIGDSKAFLLRDGILTQLSKDHTDQARLEAQGITRKPRLTQHLGIPPTEMQLSPHKVCIEAQVGDCFLLCSDGLTDMVSVDEIQTALEGAESMKCATEELINLAMDNGGRDNITVICCKIIS